MDTGIILRGILLGVCVWVGFCIWDLSERDWRNEENMSVYEKPFKLLMNVGCRIPGLRVMCSPDGRPFALKDLTYWDTVFGCFFYSITYIAFLWLLTPFPNIVTNFIFVARFEPRSENGQQQQHVHQQQPVVWHPAGGEGPHLPNF